MVGPSHPSSSDPGAFIVGESLGEGGHQRWKMVVSESELKALDTPLAKELAENLLLQQDMHFSLDAMKLWHEKYASTKEPETRLIATSLFRDAIVQFVGCFDSSAEFPLSPEAIYGHDPDGLKSFQWFKDIRDAYIAHKFGAQRQCVVGVVSQPDGRLGVGRLFARYRGQLKEDGDQLRGFMQTAANYLDAKVERLYQQLLQSVQSMTTEQIAALKNASVRTLKMPEARSTRADLQRDKPSTKR